LCSAAAVDAGTEAGSVTIRPVTEKGELQHVARLRAEAYYEDDRSRFVETFKRQFVAQEVESLQQRTTPQKPGKAPPCECMVALSAEEQEVVGCIDIRLPARATGVHPQGVPPAEEGGVYILNVVVHEDRRGQGVGKALMRAAMARSFSAWQADALYTHVEADNEVAYRLYKSCGFEDHSEERKFSGATDLGRLVLLKALPPSAPAAAAPPPS